MSTQSPVFTRAEINRLHADVARHAAESMASLSVALSSAWHAGRLLLAEKKRVRRTMGGGAWLLWLQENFHGSPRTAQRYMRLAQSISDVAFLQGMSLRQAYDRLGIATEPKSRKDAAQLQMLPDHIRLAQRLLAALRPRVASSRQKAAQRDACRRDLRALYEELRRLFESDGAGSIRMMHAGHDEP